TIIRLADEALGRQGQNPGDAAPGQKLRASAEEASREFEEAMDDDFNSALAYASLFELGKVINAHVQAYPYSSEGLLKARATLWELADVLGFDLAKPANQAEAANVKMDQVMELLLEVRAIARKKKDWEMSDLIRDRLKDLGIILEDTPQGARWTLK
ncbi:MAG: DALR domain-containing protein, partial [Desulfitobacterium hafniense]